MRFRHYKELSNIRGHVENGDPKTHPILQLVDFFAYATWIKSTTSAKSQDRWQSIKGFCQAYGWYSRRKKSVDEDLSSTSLGMSRSIKFVVEDSYLTKKILFIKYKNSNLYNLPLVFLIT